MCHRINEEKFSWLEYSMKLRRRPRNYYPKLLIRVAEASPIVVTKVLLFCHYYILMENRSTWTGLSNLTIQGLSWCPKGNIQPTFEGEETQNSQCSSSSWTFYTFSELSMCIHTHCFSHWKSLFQDTVHTAPLLHILSEKYNLSQNLDFCHEKLSKNHLLGWLDFYRLGWVG